ARLQRGPCREAGGPTGPRATRARANRSMTRPRPCPHVSRILVRLGLRPCASAFDLAELASSVRARQTLTRAAFDHQRVEAMEGETRPPVGRRAAGARVESRKAFHECGEGDPAFETGERRTDAEVGTAPECQVPVRRPADV